MKVTTSVKDKKGTRSTSIGEPEEACPMIIKRCELAMNFSYGSAEAKDEKGNAIKAFIWINGDWKVEYKGKEYLICLNDNLSALIDWINAQEN